MNNNDYYVPHVYLRIDGPNYVGSFRMKLYSGQKIGKVELVNSVSKLPPGVYPPTKYPQGDLNDHDHFFIEVITPGGNLTGVEYHYAEFTAKVDELSRKVPCEDVKPGEEGRLLKAFAYTNTAAVLKAQRKTKIKWADADDGGSGDN